MLRGPHCSCQRGQFTKHSVEMAAWIVEMEGRGDPHVCNLKEEEEEGDDSDDDDDGALHCHYSGSAMHQV